MPIDLLDPFSLAQIVGYLSMALGIVALLQHCDIRIRFFMASSSILLATHFIMIDSYTAAAISILSASRAGLSMFHGMRQKAHIFVPFFIGIIVITALFTAERWFDFLPMISTSISTYGYFYWRHEKLRYALIASSSLWSVHNIFSMSYGPLMMEILLIGTNIYRLRTPRKRAQPVEQG